MTSAVIPAPYSVWHVEITQATFDAFNALIPLEGARVWILRAGLEHFLARVEGDYHLRDRLHKEIWKYSYETPTPRGLIPIQARMPSELHNRFRKLFPEKGSMAWFMRGLFDGLVTILQEADFDLNEKIEQAVNEALREKVST